MIEGASTTAEGDHAANTRRRIASSAGVAVAASAEAQAPSTADPDLTRRALTHAPQTPTDGNPRRDVTIVEFFDYNCPNCMKAQPALEQLLAVDHGIRMVYKDWPIFGAGSIMAARVALAA